MIASFFFLGSALASSPAALGIPNHGGGFAGPTQPGVYGLNYTPTAALSACRERRSGRVVQPVHTRLGGTRKTAPMVWNAECCRRRRKCRTEKEKTGDHSLRRRLKRTIAPRSSPAGRTGVDAGDTLLQEQLARLPRFESSSSSSLTTNSKLT